MGDNQAKSEIRRKVFVTVVGAVAGGAVSYIVQRALAAWGALDTISDAFGRWLKVNVTPQQAGWTVALLISIALYALLLWRVWRRDVVHIHHKEITALATGSSTVEKEFIRAPQRDAPLTEGALYAVLGEWGLFGGIGHFASDKVQRSDGDRIVDWLPEFEQKARDGALHVWGRPRQFESALQEPIDPNHWTTHTVDFLATVMGEPRSRPRVTMSAEGGYGDLMVSKAEFESEWPHAA